MSVEPDSGPIENGINHISSFKASVEPSKKLRAGRTISCKQSKEFYMKYSEIISKNSLPKQSLPNTNTSSSSNRDGFKTKNRSKLDLSILDEESFRNRSYRLSCIDAMIANQEQEVTKNISITKELSPKNEFKEEATRTNFSRKARPVSVNDQLILSDNDAGKSLRQEPLNEKVYDNYNHFKKTAGKVWHKSSEKSEIKPSRHFRRSAASGFYFGPIPNKKESKGIKPSIFNDQDKCEVTIHSKKQFLAFKNRGLKTRAQLEFNSYCTSPINPPNTDPKSYKPFSLSIETNKDPIRMGPELSKESKLYTTAQRFAPRGSDSKNELDPKRIFKSSSMSQETDPACYQHLKFQTFTREYREPVNLVMAPYVMKIPTSNPRPKLESRTASLNASPHRNRVLTTSPLMSRLRTRTSNGLAIRHQSSVADEESFEVEGWN